MTKPLSCEIAFPITAPVIEAARTIAIVSQMGIGSGPGIASRASAPVTNPEMRIARMTLAVIGLRRANADGSYGRRRRRGERDQVAAVALDRLADRRRVR